MPELNTTDPKDMVMTVIHQKRIGPAVIPLGWEPIVRRMKQLGWAEVDGRITQKGYPGVYGYEDWYEAVISLIEGASRA